MSSEQRFRRMTIRGSAAALGAAGLFAWLAGRQLTQRPDPDDYTNPGALDLPFDPVVFPSRDGVTLRGWFIPKEDARGAIIFCPGHTGSVHSDLACAPWFHQAGYALLMFDWRGRGRSDGAASLQLGVDFTLINPIRWAVISEQWLLAGKLLRKQLAGWLDGWMVEHSASQRAIYRHSDNVFGS